MQTGTVQDTDDLPAQQKECGRQRDPDPALRRPGRGDQRGRARQGRRDARRLPGHGRRGEEGRRRAELVGDVYDAAPYGIAIPKTAGIAKDAILGAVQALIEDGTYKAILDKWGVAGGAITDPAINGATA